MAIPLIPTLEVLLPLRGESIVVTTMGAAREWPKLSSHPLDLHYLPSAMGQAPSLGLGLALSDPRREVLVINGDGAMLMSLGSLVTIVASGVQNLTLLVLDNGRYEVTGGQQTAAAVARQFANVDFSAAAQAAGFRTVRRFEQLDDWRRAAAELLASPGPRFCHLVVEPVTTDYQLKSPGPMVDRLSKFRAALASEGRHRR